MDPLLKSEEITIDSYFNSENELKHELVINVGEGGIGEIIKYLLDPVKKETVDRNRNRNRKKTIRLNNPLTLNQLRKYYDSFLKIYNNSCLEEEKKIQLIMLRANSEYSATRLKAYRFSIFLCNRIDIVLNKNGAEFRKNLKALKLHLEALVAYYPKK